MVDQIDPRDKKVTLQNWWDYHHEGKGDYHQWLTGSAGPEVWRYLNIAKYIKPRKVVLNIGVGLGYCTKELVRRKCVVHALDISLVALEKVKAFAAKTWLPSEFSDIPEKIFNLAISNLVTQHMADHDLLEQISGVLKSLKPGGIFSMQFAFALDKQQNDMANPPIESMKGGSVYRSLEGMARLVDRAGGQIAWANLVAIFPDFGCGWYAIHIVRPDYPFPTSFDLAQSTFFDRVFIKLKRIAKRVLMVGKRN